MSQLLRDKNGKFQKGNEGFWNGKKRGKLSPTWRKKISEGLKKCTTRKVHILTEEEKKKMSERFRKLREAGKLKCSGWKHTPEWKRKMSMFHKKNGTGKWMLGRKQPDFIKEKSRQRWLGSKNPRWKGGVTQRERNLRWSWRGKVWRRNVFKKFDGICFNCGSTQKLNAHHILDFENNPNFRFSVANGILLCYKCHKKLHKEWNIRKESSFQLLEEDGKYFLITKKRDATRKGVFIYRLIGEFSKNQFKLVNKDLSVCGVVI